MEPSRQLGIRNASVQTAEQARDALFDQFKDNTVPLLKDMEAQMSTRRDDYIVEATDSSNKAIEMQENQADLSRESLGISLTPEQQLADSRLNKLGGAASRVSATNEAVDVADRVNENQANAITSIQTGLTQDALANLSGADSLKDAREGGDASRKSQARSQNFSSAGAAIGLAAMMM